MFGLFRRSSTVQETRPKAKASRKSLRVPLTWEDRFASIPEPEAIEGDGEADWSQWDDSVAARQRAAEEEQQRKRN